MDEEYEGLLLRLAGSMKANNQLLSALIATHPEPELLRELWHASKPEWIDEQSEMLHFQHSLDYRAGLLERLSSISGEIDDI